MPAQPGAAALYFRSPGKKALGFLFGFFMTLAGLCQAAIKPDISLSYGQDSAQMLDIYLPSQPKSAPVLMMVTGSDWSRLNRDSPSSLKKKLEYWRPKGFIYIEANYRLLPDATPEQQAQDLAKAIVYVQQRISLWGGDGKRLVLMGADSGGQLLALLGANPRNYAELKPWRASLLLDAALLDLPATMNAKHPRSLDQAFASGGDWSQLSPLHQLKGQAVPVLAVCSRRRDYACPQAQVFIGRAQQLGVKAQLLEQDIKQRKIASELGRDQAYSDSLAQFIDAQLSAP